MPAPRRHTQPRPSARSARQERARDATRAQIADAALRLFVDEGVERVSMRRIADAVGYTPGALYAYFRDKDEILYALQVEGFARLLEPMRAIDVATLTPGERLYRFGEVYLQFAFENPQLYQLMFITSRLGQRIREDKKWEVGLDNYDRVRRAVRDCMTVGVIPRGELEAATFATWAQVHGIAAIVIRGRFAGIISDEDLPRVVRDAYQFAFGALLPAHAKLRSARPRHAAPRTRRR
jgi:AcrR family transcriptional regulator